MLARLGRRPVFLIAAAFTVALGMIPEFVSLLQLDKAWYLQAADQLLDGMRPYVDQFIEMNPPLIMWLNLIPTSIARVLHLSPILMFRLSVSAAALGLMGLSGRLLLALLGPEAKVRRRYCILLFLFALFPLAHEDFGQREHLLFALVLPYVLLAVCRAEGMPVASFLATVIGMLAGVGLALKPFFFAFWLLLEGWLLLQGRRRVPFWRAERLAVVLTSLLYVLAVVIWTPEYFDLVHLLAGWQRTYLHKSLHYLVVSRTETWLTLGTGLALLVLWRVLQLRSLWAALWTGAAGCLASAVLQGKGFGYHYYPSMAFGMVLLAGMAGDVRGPLSGTLRRATFAAVAAGSLTLVVRTVAASTERFREGLNWRNTELGQVIAFVRTHDVEHRVFLINSGLWESVIAAYSGAKPTSRLMHVGPLDAAYREAIRSPQPLVYRKPEDMGPLETFVIRTVVADFNRGHPLLLLVRGPGPDQPDQPTPVRFDRWTRLDYIEYFSHDSGFARTLRGYTFAGTIGHYRAYRPLRQGEIRVPPPPRPNAGVPARVVEMRRFGLRFGWEMGALLLFVISFCLLVFKDRSAQAAKLFSS